MCVAHLKMLGVARCPGLFLLKRLLSRLVIRSLHDWRACAGATTAMPMRSFGIRMESTK